MNLKKSHYDLGTYYETTDSVTLAETKVNQGNRNSPEADNVRT